jgi:hypothetical protein
MQNVALKAGFVQKDCGMSELVVLSGSGGAKNPKIIHGTKP